MTSKALARALIAAAAMSAGCEAEKSNVQKGRDPEVPALAPGAPAGQGGDGIDRGTVGGAAPKAP